MLSGRQARRWMEAGCRLQKRRGFGRRVILRNRLFMANHISALKRVRETERRTDFNRVAKTRLRNQIRAMRKALTAKDHGDLNATMASTFSLLDKAARKGYIKMGTAARYKSRLHTRVKAVTGQTK
jgi:small subunit ribosomal protein S20